MEQLKLVKSYTNSLLKKAELLNKEYSGLNPSSDEASKILDNLVRTMSEITLMQRRAIDIAKGQQLLQHKQSA